MQKEYDLNLPVGGTTQQLSLPHLLPAETLIRLNPHWIVEKLTTENNTFTAALKDHETEQAFQLTGCLASTAPQTLELCFLEGDYEKICFFQKDNGFWAEVCYRSGQEEPSEAIERLTVLWIRSIREYLRLYLTNTPNTIFFRFIMNRVILNMTPSQRKISLMLIRLTVLEIIVILLIVVGYVLFANKPLGSP